MEEPHIRSHLHYLDPHVHFEGSLPLVELPTYSRQAEIPLDQETNFGLGRTISAPSAAALQGRPQNFPDFIALYVKCSSLLRHQENMLAAITNFINSNLSQGITEAHVYFSLQTHLLLGADLGQLADNLRLAQHLASARGLHLAWIFDLVRGVSAFEKETVDFALNSSRQNINALALGLAGDESRGYAEHYGEIFKQAKKAGLQSI
ncbi:MAG: hypothetical protein PHC51_12400, partial [bacterium]|nr:hypothetical protein [bacterium]